VGVTAVAAFAPVWLRYGWSFFTFYNDHARPSAVTIATRGTLELWGTIGVVGIAVALLGMGIAVWRDVPRSMPPSQNRLLVPALLTWLSLYVVAFLALPDQAGYLIPLEPALLLVLARFAARPAFQVACICLLVSPWIELSSGKVAQGRILTDHNVRLGTLRDVRQFVAMTEEKLPRGTTVVVGAWQPIIEELFAGTPTHNRYAYLLTRSELDAAAVTGEPLAYATEVVRGFNHRVHGVDLAAYGAQNVRQLLLGVP
jgi:hypothetical protein